MTKRLAFPTLLCLALAACGPGNDSTSSTPAAQQASSPEKKTSASSRVQSVTPTLTKIESIPLILESQGNVISLDEVDLRPQKTGTIKQIHFHEGDEVKPGQLLFSLDARDDEANLKKAEARLAGSRAQLEIAQRDWLRAQDLANKNFISQTGLDASRAKLDAAESTLAQDIAALDSAKILLSYDYIRAPFAGRAGRIDVRAGSLVQANSSVSLVKITRMNPIGVSFTLPERALSELAREHKNKAVKVSIDLPDGTKQEGTIIFIENSIDRTSGTISIKARFANEEQRLWPGQFVSVQVRAGEISNAVTLPAQAVQSGNDGHFVYIIQDDQTVKQQAVKLVQIYQERAIVTGIAGNVKVVLEGSQNLRPGSKIMETASAPAGTRRSKGGQRGSAARAASLPN